METSINYENSFLFTNSVVEKEPSLIKNGIVLGAIGISSFLMFQNIDGHLKDIEYFHSQNTLSSLTISNDKNYDFIPFSSSGTENSAIISMNNEKLEVDDLADRVTQTQLDEVKSHFDTKVFGLEKNLKLHIDNKLLETTTALKDFISEENKGIKKDKSNNLKFLVGSIVVPIIAALIGAYLATR